MPRIAQSKLVVALAAAGLFCGAMSQAQATPLDKLIGKSLTAGNLVFSGFQAQFVGIGPSAVDVQALVVTDPDTGKQQAGLRFVMIQSGVPAPFVMSPKAGPHEIDMQIVYSVTDTSGQLSTITTTTNATVVGQAGVFENTDAANIDSANSANPTLTYMFYCNWFGSLCQNSSSSPAIGAGFVATSGNPTFSAPLFSGLTTYVVRHEVQMQISNRKGVPGGTATLQGFDTLFSE